MTAIDRELGTFLAARLLASHYANDHRLELLIESADHGSQPDRYNAIWAIAAWNAQSISVESL